MLLKNKKKTLYLSAFSLFLISALYGLILRWNFAFPSTFITYDNLLQGHSHVAFLGWGYLASIAAILHCFIPKEKRKNNVYLVVLGIILISIIFMLISFVSGGYNVFSIVLLSVFGITSYVLSFRILKDLRGTNISVKLIRYGIYYYLLSSLATWFLAGVLLTQGKTDLYYNTVYFYLHFLYNGYFVFILFGLLFNILERQQIKIAPNTIKLFFIYLNAACIPAYFLSVLWSTDNNIFYVIGFMAAVLQVISLIFLTTILKQLFSQIKWGSISKLLLRFAMVAYGLKIILQLLSAFPYFVKKSLMLKPFFIIGYLHLFTLVFMSVFIMLIMNQLRYFKLKTIVSKTGIIFFLIGILLTEVLLFLQGSLYLWGITPINHYHIALLVCSILIVLGIALLTVSLIKSGRTSEIKNIHN